MLAVTSDFTADSKSQFRYHNKVLLLTLRYAGLGVVCNKGLETFHNEERGKRHDLYCLGGQNGKHEVGWACSTYGGEKKRVRRFREGNQRERDQWEDFVVDGRILLKCILKKWFGGRGFDLSGLKTATNGGLF